MAPERLGPGAAAEEEHGPVEDLRAADPAEGEEQRVDPPCRCARNASRVTGMYVSPAVVPEVLQ
jgi:hypothetical protein